MNTPRNDPRGDRLPWPTWMSGPDRAAAEAAATADTVVFNRAALHDALTHDHRLAPRPLSALDTTEDETAAPASPPVAARPPDIGPWLTLMVLGLGIVTVMLVVTVTWT